MCSRARHDCNVPVNRIVADGLLLGESAIKIRTLNSPVWGPRDHYGRWPASMCAAVAL